MKRTLKPLLLALCAAATAYALVLLLTRDVDTPNLWPYLLSWTGAQAAALCVLNYLLRGQRWRLWMAHYQHPLPWRTGLRLYLMGYTFTPTPGNVGEAIRGLLLPVPLSTAQSLSIFGAERIADLSSLLLLTLPGVLWLLVRPALAPWLPMVLTLLGASCLLLLGLAWRFSARLRLRWDWLRQAWACLRHQPWQWLALTVLAWVAQGLALWLLCRDFGVYLDPSILTGFYALAMVGGALSLLPAGLGGTEVILTGLLLGAGATLSAAVAITVLVRLLTLWLAVGLGALALAYSAAWRRDLSLS